VSSCGTFKYCGRNLMEQTVNSNILEKWHVCVLAFQSQVLQSLITLTNTVNEMKQQLDFVTTVMQDMHGNRICCRYDQGWQFPLLYCTCRPSWWVIVSCCDQMLLYIYLLVSKSAVRIISWSCSNIAQCAGQYYCNWGKLSSLLLTICFVIQLIEMDTEYELYIGVREKRS